MSETSVDDILAEADRLAGENHLEDALAGYARVLSLEPDRVAALEGQARALAATHRLDEAIATQDRVIALMPVSLEARVAKADLLSMRGQYEQAIEALEAASALQPSDRAVLLRLGDTYRVAGQTIRAIEVYQRGTATRPQDAELWAHLGDALIDAGRADEAMDALDRAARLDTTFSEIDWNIRADRYYIERQHDEAMRFYQRALEVKPNAASWRGLGLIHYTRGEFEEALRCCAAGLELEPDNLELLNNSGIALYELRRFVEAGASFERMTRLDPRSLDGWLNLGYTHRDAGRPDLAIVALQRAAELSPGNAEAWVAIGLCELDVGDRQTGLTRALDRFNRAIDLAPDSMWAWNNSGWALGELKQYDEALRRIDRAIELASDEVVPWSNKADLLSRTGRVDEAENCLRQMLSSAADPAFARVAMSEFLAHYREDDDGALQTMLEADRLHPNDVTIGSNLAEALIRVGHYPQARARAREVIALGCDSVTRCVLMFCIYASHVLEGDRSPAREAAFADFVNEYRAEHLEGPVGPRWWWSYRTLVRAIRRAACTPEDQFVLLMAIDLQDGTLDARQTSFFAKVGTPETERQPAVSSAPPRSL